MNQVFTGNTEYFPCVKSRIAYEGRESDNPLAFKFYDENKMVAGKTMREHLRFAVCYWHSFCGDGADPFGPGTRHYAWVDHADPMQAAEQKQDAAFEFFSKLGVPYYCFHDRDMAPEGDSVLASEKNLHIMTERATALQRETGLKLLWGTANLFSHPRYQNGAATNPDFHVLAHAAAQVKAALDATITLGGENYVFWGGREGYASLLNTRTDIELDNLARFLQSARDYGHANGFNGTFLIEPKPMEPMKHQYDFDASTVIGFLRHYGLDGDFKVNIEANHATLAGHSFAHELQMCANAGLLGSIDANRGDPQNGWDTDQFPLNLYDTTEAMLVILTMGGLGNGGLNFDAKVRRESTAGEDLFLGHIGAMDAFARGLEVAQYLIEHTDFIARRDARYTSHNSVPGQRFRRGELTLPALAQIAQEHGEPSTLSGMQEWYENTLNHALINA